MTRPRRFDHDEARRLRAEGLTLREIGRRLGVSREAVHRVVDDGVNDRHKWNNRAAFHRRYGHDDEYTERLRRQSRDSYHRRKAREASPQRRGAT